LGGGKNRGEPATKDATLLKRSKMGVDGDKRVTIGPGTLSGSPSAQAKRVHFQTWGKGLENQKCRTIKTAIGVKFKGGKVRIKETGRSTWREKHSRRKGIKFHTGPEPHRKSCDTTQARILHRNILSRKTEKRNPEKNSRASRVHSPLGGNYRCREPLNNKR